jgi:hypothetical protein
LPLQPTGIHYVAPSSASNSFLLKGVPGCNCILRNCLYQQPYLIAFLPILHAMVARIHDAHRLGRNLVPYCSSPFRLQHCSWTQFHRLKTDMTRSATGVRSISSEASQRTEPRICLPGFGMKVNERSQRSWDTSANPNQPWKRSYDFVDWTCEAVTLREISMLKFIEAITNKPEWRRKVYDEEIVRKWKGECVGVDEKAFSERMFDCVSCSLFLLLAKAVLFTFDHDGNSALQN